MSDDDFFDKTADDGGKRAKKKASDNFQFRVQEQRWSQIDKKMTKTLTAQGNFKKVISSDSVVGLMVPPSVRRKFVNDYLRKLKKDHIAAQDARFKKYMLKRTKFNPTDALEMLFSADTKQYAQQRNNMAGNVAQIKVRLYHTFTMYSGFKSLILDESDALNHNESIHDQLKREIRRYHKANDTFNKYQESLYKNLSVNLAPTLSYTKRADRRESTKGDSSGAAIGKLPLLTHGELQKDSARGDGTAAGGHHSGRSQQMTSGRADITSARSTARLSGRFDSARHLTSSLADLAISKLGE